MSTINITNARANLYDIANQVIESHEPVTVTGKNGNVVLLSEDDFVALMETLHLQSVPGLSLDAQALNDDDMDNLTPRDDLEW